MSFIDVIDPINRSGKITVPMSKLDETRGLSEFLKGKAPEERKDLSLCLLFQQNRCNAGARCHQIHADKVFVTELRDRALSAKLCCANHGDIHSIDLLNGGRIMTISSLNAETGATTLTNYALSSFAKTAAIDFFLANPRRVILEAKLCRLHKQGRCKYGKDCKNIHLCGSAEAVLAAPQQRSAPVSQRFVPSSSLTAPMPMTSFVKPYSVQASAKPLESSSLMNRCEAVDLNLSSASACGLSCVSDSPIPNRSGDQSSEHSATVQPLDISSLSVRTDDAEQCFARLFPMDFNCKSSFLSVSSPPFSEFEDSVKQICCDLSMVEAGDLLLSHTSPLAAVESKASIRAF